MKLKTVRRDFLKRDIQLNRVEARLSLDDDWLPAKYVTTETASSVSISQCVPFVDWDFKTMVGMAYIDLDDDKDIIILKVQADIRYYLRYKI